jgi:hypothetical protein
VAAGYFLRAQELVDLVDNQPEKAIKRWLQQHVTDPVSVSVIGLAQARAQIETIAAPDERAEAHSRLARIVAAIRHQSGEPLVFDAEVAELWQRMLAAPSLATQVPKVALQEYALATAYGLTIAEGDRAWHEALRALGVRIEALT